MKLIEKIRIKGFRSIQDDSLNQLSDFTAFAGLNNSGKSNILRALNAFFNGETDVGQRVVISDFFRKHKTARNISISITFCLPQQFKFPKRIKHIEEFLGNRSFSITKEWNKNEILPAYYLNNDNRLELDDRQKIDQFLQLINFRYIPNRVLPIDLIRNEHRALTDVLVRRLGRKARGQEKAFDIIKETSNRMIQSLADRFQQACPGVGDVRLATPTSWGDMVFAFGYRLGHDGIEMPDTVQGSGIQSLLMFETLYLIDRDYFQKFGWRQAAIWAVEEPESSLHTSLEATMASYLSTISTNPDNRLQVFCTTHSDIMLQYADNIIIVEQQDGKSKFFVKTVKREALEYLSKCGISHWTHPLLFHPSEPLILVEGKYDNTFFEQALKYFNCKKNIRVSYLEELAGRERTGGTDLIRYIKDNIKPIQVRSKDHPVIVVLDWDAANKKQEIEKHFSATDDPIKILVWPESSFNPNLGKDFRGVERTFSDRLIQQAINNGAPIEKTESGKFVVADKDQYGKVKDILHNIVKKDLQQEDLIYANDFIKEVLKAAGAIS